MTTPDPANRPPATLSPPGKVAAAVALACALAAPFEGLRNYAYIDPVGIPTICLGSTEGVKLGQYKTNEQCIALMGKEMTLRVETVNRCVPGLPVNMLAAWASAVFNTGYDLVCNVRTSTAARLLAAGRWLEACRQLPRWNQGTIAGIKTTLPGLTRRRNAEMQLCETP